MQRLNHVSGLRRSQSLIFSFELMPPSLTASGIHDAGSDCDASRGGDLAGNVRGLPQSGPEPPFLRCNFTKFAPCIRRIGDPRPVDVLQHPWLLECYVSAKRWLGNLDQCVVKPIRTSCRKLQKLLSGSQQTDGCRA